MFIYNCLLILCSKSVIVFCAYCMFCFIFPHFLGVYAHFRDLDTFQFTLYFTPRPAPLRVITFLSRRPLRTLIVLSFPKPVAFASSDRVISSFSLSKFQIIFSSVDKSFISAKTGSTTRIEFKNTLYFGFSIASIEVCQ